jgi:hypothetical protein
VRQQGGRDSAAAVTTTLQKYYHNRETLLKLYSTCVTEQKTYTVFPKVVL